MVGGHGIEDAANDAADRVGAVTVVGDVLPADPLVVDQSQVVAARAPVRVGAGQALQVLAARNDKAGVVQRGGVGSAGRACVARVGALQRAAGTEKLDGVGLVEGVLTFVAENIEARAGAISADGRNEHPCLFGLQQV